MTMTDCKARPGEFVHLSSSFAATLAEAGVGMYSFDSRTRSFVLDDACRRIFDVDPHQELSSEILVSRIHPDDLDRYWQAATEGLRTGVFACEYRVVHRDGSIHFINGRARAETDAASGSIRLTGICIDVTDHRTLAEELQDAEERMQNLADGVPGLFALLDRDYIIRFLSASYDGWFGFPRIKALHQHISMIVGQEAFEKRKPMYDRCLKGETVHYHEERRMTNGEERYYQVTYKPARSRSGEIRGVLSLAIDITERHRAELELEQRSRELQRSNQDLEQFAYVASHDLKAPLRSIEVLVDWLREDLTDYKGGEVQENLELLKQRTGRLHRLLDDLLAYSRAGRKPGAVARTDTRVLVNDLITLLSPPPGIRVIADESLPVLYAHYTPLEQVLRNLINNAIKHHPGPEGTIRVYAQEQDGGVLFAVEDDGAGIPEQFATKVFQMFQTLKPRDEVEGSGMGLAIVKRIVEWQGGRVWFHPGPGGRGTVFKFIWRRLPEEQSSPGQGSASTTAGEEHHHDESEQPRAHLAG